MNDKLLCLFVDALNPEYIRHMPYLSSLARENLYGELEVPLAFTGIIASFFTGMQPKKHGIVDLFVPGKPEFKNKFMANFSRLIHGKRFFYTPPAKKPGFFMPSMEKAWPQKGCLKYPTLFDILEKNEKTFEVIDWPNHFTGRKAKTVLSKSSDKIIHLIKQSSADFIFAHFLDLETAHKYGISSKQTIECAKKLDEKIASLNAKRVLIFSDHGMADIKKEIDIEEKISRLNLRWNEEVIYLIGSTTARFWFKNSVAKEKILNMLSEIKEGRILEEEKFELPKTADIVFLLNNGFVFMPNFFLKKRFKAMHGWQETQKTIYIIKADGLKGKKDARIIDMFPTILDLMRVEKIKCDGSSLIR